MPFAKGQSGNPGGRPKDKPFAEALRMELKAAGKDHRALRKIARALIAKAEDGDLPAIREIADRLDGKVTTTDVPEESGDGILNVFINTGVIREGDEDSIVVLDAEGRVIDRPRVEAKNAETVDD
jgi:hypothetical protein